ncbi:MAG: c-type cytochrome [Magnetovibrionaceae bacterium]
MTRKAFARSVRHSLLGSAALILASFSTVQADFVGHGGMVRAVALSPDGQSLLTASFDYTMKRWNFQTQEETAEFDVHEGPVNDVAFSPDGKQALSVSDDGTAILWDMATNAQLFRMTGHAHKVMSAAFSSDGKLAATGSWDRTARIWDTATGEAIATISNTSPVNVVAFGPGDEVLFVGGHDGVIRMFSAETGDSQGQLEGHGLGITRLSLSPDGATLLSAGIDRSIRLWDIASMREVRQLKPHGEHIFAADFTSDGRGIISGDKEGQVLVTNLDTGQISFSVNAHDAIVWDVAVSPDGRFAVSASSDESVRVWHLETGDRIGFEAEAANRYEPWLTSDHPGAQYFTSCAKCHEVTAEGPKRSGPHFEGLFGRTVGGLEGYNYSKALREADFVWDHETIKQLFTEGPDVMLPGTKMPVQKVPDEQALEQLVDYIAVLTGATKPDPIEKGEAPASSEAN